MVLDGVDKFGFSYPKYLTTLDDLILTYENELRDNNGLIKTLQRLYRFYSRENQVQEKELSLIRLKEGSVLLDDGKYN